jgi:hypothetical protein
LMASSPTLPLKKEILCLGWSHPSDLA